MMRPSSPSLRRRIIGAYVLLAIAVSGCFGGLTVETLLSIEQRVVGYRLLVRADALIANANARGVTHIPGLPQVYHGAEISPSFRDLSPGVHKMELDGRSLQILIRDVAGQRYAVVDDVSRFARIEHKLLYSLASAFGISILAAVVLGFITASRVIAPVTQLAKAVQAGNLSRASALQAANDEIGLLARAFANHSAQLSLFLERERVFTGDVSHELRTPLTVILGAAELLQLRLDHLPELQSAAERIRRTAAEASERVNALLLLSRSPDLIDIGDIDLVPIARAEIDRCVPMVASKPVKLTFSAVEPQIFARAQVELAAIAIGNLVRNACQVTESGEVRVHIDETTVVVDDTGPGIPAGIRESIFERHGVASRSKGAGAGLGLAIVRRVAEHLAWDVAVTYPPAGGTRFALMFQRSALGPISDSSSA